MSKGIFALVGMQHRPGAVALLKTLQDGAPLRLLRDPRNPVDSNAVQVWHEETHIGYIRASQVTPLAIAMDAMQAESRSELEFRARLSTRNGERWPMVVVED